MTLSGGRERDWESKPMTLSEASKSTSKVFTCVPFGMHVPGDYGT